MSAKHRMVIIDGIVEIDSNISNMEFTERFIDWIESNGWCFGGAIKDYREDDGHE